MNWGKQIFISITQHKRIVLCNTMLVIFCLSMHTLIARLSSINHCVFNFDNRLSSDVCKQIADIAQQRILAGECYADVAQAITKEFSCVDEVIIHHCAPTVVACDISSVQPLVRVNDAYVVNEHGALLALNNFSPLVLGSLSNIEVDHLDTTMNMPHSFVATAQKLIPFLFDTHTVRWIDDKKIIVQEKEDPRFSLICNAAVLPDKQILAYCGQLKKICLSKPKVLKTQQWSADIRFKGQIVLANPPVMTRPTGDACQGGVAHG